MILLRGIKGKEYASKIQDGLVDCRDFLSSLLNPPVTGYTFSDYYEKNLVKALVYFYRKIKPSEVDLKDPDFLYSLLTDYYVPYIYLTYFHILNKTSVKWLYDNFDDEYSFIAIDVKLDRITKTAIGDGYFGAKMKYVNHINEIAQNKFLEAKTACMCSLENNFYNKQDMIMSLQIYNTLFFPLLCREREGKFSDIENEFRLFAYDCPWSKDSQLKQLNGYINIYGQERGAIYKGDLVSGENSIFESNERMLADPCMSVGDLLKRENGNISISSRFKSIDITDIANECWYFETKQECEMFVKEMLRKPRKTIYTNQTIRKRYEIDGMKDAVFCPGYQKVEY